MSSAKVFSEEEVANMIVSASQRWELDAELLYTLASVESDFNPLAIAVETTEKKAKILKELDSPEIRVRLGKTFHSGLTVVSIRPKDYETARFIIRILEENEFIFDVGLFQINTCNFTLEEVDEMFSPRQNIEKACIHLKSCTKQFSDKIHQIECYNRGGGNLRKMLKTKKRYYPYYKRFKKHQIRKNTFKRTLNK